MSRKKQLHRALSSVVIAAGVLCHGATAAAITFDAAANEYFETVDEWGQGGGTESIGLRFGSTLQESLVFNQLTQKFIFSDDVDVRGTLSGAALTIQGGDSTFLGRMGVGSSATPDTQLEVVGTISGSNLRVQNTLSVSGSLVMEQNTILTGSTLQGFGLSDCDTGATSKLLWDSATGRFSCGTDQSGGSVPEVGTESFSGGVIVIGDSRYVLTQGDTMTGGLTIDGQTDQVQLNVQADDAQSGNIVDIENYDSTSNYMTIDAGGATQFFGNVTLGDSSMDTAVFNAYVGSSILPSSDNTYDLGGGSNRWGNIYGNNGYFYLANATYMNGTFGTFGNATISGTTNCNGASVLATDISGNVYCDTDNDTLASFGITDGGTTETVDQGETITFSDGTDINVAVSPTNTVSVAFTNATGYITAAGVPGAETDPEYSANTYAIDMNQNVGTDDAPSYSDLTLSTLSSCSALETDGAGAVGCGTDDAPNIYAIDMNQYVGTDDSPTFPGVTLSNMTQGSVIFAGASGVLSQDNAMFFWDDATDHMGIGTATPDRRLELLDTTGPQLRLTYTDSSSYVDFGTDTSGDLTISPTGANTTFTGNVTIGALANCDTIDTDGSGNLSCGTDDGGGGGISYVSAEGMFVNQAGDTMTGALHIQSGNAATATTASLLNIRGAMSGKLLHVSGTGASTAPLIATDLRFGSIIMGTGAIQDGSRRIMPQLLVKNRVPQSYLGSGTLAGNPNDVVVQGNYAYVAMEGGAYQGLSVMDISKPNTPTQVSFLSLANGPQSLVAQGQYVYTVSNPVEVIDISNPANPRKISEVSVNGGGYHAVMQGGYLYLPSQVLNGLEIVDVRNPRNPELVGSIATGGTSQPWGIAVQGNYAFLGNTNLPSVSVIDISNPKKPFVVDELSTGSGPWAVAVQGRYLYVADSNGLETFDIADPTNIPAAVSTVDLDSLGYRMAVSGKHLYVAQHSNGSILTLDISDPSTPVRMGTMPMSGVHGVAVQGRYVIDIAYYTKAFNVFDMGGAQIDQLEAGATTLGSLDVRTKATIGHDLTVQGAAAFGRGMHVAGPTDIQQTSTGAFALTIASSTGGLRIGAQGTVDQPHVQFGTGTTFDAKLFRPSARTLRIDSNLQVVNVFSGATVYATRSFSGAGLSASTDCDTALTSKLLWDAATGRFSCGTDQSGASGIVNHYVLASGDTMTGALTIDVAGENTTALSVSGATILNSSGKDNDVSIKNNQNNLIFFADASLSQVQIGQGSGPEYTLDVYDSSGTWGFKVGQGSAGQQLRLGDNEIGSFNAGSPAALYINPDGGNVGVGKTTAKAALDVLGTMSGTVVRGQNTLASSGTLVFEGAGSGASLYLGSFLQGAGLRDCDTGATSKLLWDEATGRFSCGTDQGGSGAPGGSDTYVQYNDATAFGGEAEFTWNETTDLLNVRGTMSGSVVHASSRLASSGVLVLRPGNQLQPTLYANGGQKVGINTASPHSSFTSSGTFATSVRVVTATGSINGGDQIIFASGSSMITLTLPTAVGINGRQYTIKKTSATNDSQIRPVIIATTSSQTIDRVSRWRLTNRGQQVTVVSDGANWQVVDASGYGLNGGFISMGNTMNQWYGAPGDGTALTTAVLTTTATIRVLPFIAQKVMTINGMSVSVQTTAASAEVRLAIYNDTGRGYPDTLVVDAGTVATTATGQRSICPSGCTTTGGGTLPVTIQPGLYWLAINNNSLAHTLRGWAVGNLNPINGFPSAYTTLRNVGWQVTNAYTAYPTQFPTTGATATTAAPLPAVTVRMQE